MNIDIPNGAFSQWLVSAAAAVIYTGRWQQQAVTALKPLAGAI